MRITSDGAPPSRRLGRSVGAATAAALLIVAIAGCGGGAGDESDGGSAEATLKVGYPASLSGFLGPYDLLISNGAQLAADEINAAGGIDGKTRIEIDIRDAKSETQTVAALGQEFIDEGVQALFSTCNVEAQIALASVGDRSGVPTFSACNADPAIGETFPTYFGVGLGQNALSARAVDYMVQQGYSTVYILSSPDLAYFKNSARFLTEAAEVAGLRIIGEDTFDLGQKDFGVQVGKLSNLPEPPDVIWSPIFAPEVGTLLKELRAAGVTAPFVGTDSMDTPLTITVGGSASEGGAFPTLGFPEEGSRSEEVVAAYRDVYGTDPEGSFAFTGYNMVKVLEAAVKKAGSTDPEAITAALAGGLDVPDALPGLEYKPGSHSPEYPVPMVVVTQGRFVLESAEWPTFVPAP